MSCVIMRISEIGFRYAFCLPDEVAIVAASTETRFSHLPGEPRADVLVLTVDMPGAPEGAVEVMAVYTDNGKPGTIELESFRWYRADGTVIEPAAESAVAKGDAA